MSGLLKRREQLTDLGLQRDPGQVLEFPGPLGVGVEHQVTLAPVIGKIQPLSGILRRDDPGEGIGSVCIKPVVIYLRPQRVIFSLPVEADGLDAGAKLPIYLADILLDIAEIQAVRGQGGDTTEKIGTYSPD